MEKSYLRGLLGALLGGIIASIPWILVYVYANMIYSILAVFIAYGALKGYQWFGGKVDKKLPIFLVIISLLSITISTLVIIPALLLVKEDAVPSITNLNFLYSNKEFFSALIGDYVISILFTLLGISGVISNIRSQIKSSEENGNINISLSNGNNKKERDKIKDYFTIRGALKEENAVKIEEGSDLNSDALDYLISECIVIKKEDKYYYLVEEEERLNKKNKKTIIILFTVLGTIMLSVFLLTFNSSKDKNVVENQPKYNVPKSYIKSKDKENEDSWFYIPDEDVSGDSGYIMVYYLDGEYVYSDSLVETMKNSFSNYEDFNEIKSTDYFKSKKDLDVLKFDISFEDYIDTIYYIFGSNRLAIVEVVDYDKLKDLQKDAKEVVDSFKW